MVSNDDSSIWLEIMEKYRNSVIQLICVKAIYDPSRPQNTPKDRKASGTGFIIDIERGLVITNAHVVSNAISIVGRMVRFGEYDLILRTVSICREKDIALCQLSKADRENISLGKSPNQINMIFGDNMLLKETEPVVAIGYPLGQKNLKYTTGVVSGFHANSDGDDDDDGMVFTEEESPSYIQVTAPINPGNSGGPLLNHKGEVVGVNAAGYMFSQNIGYAIGSRIVLGIFNKMVAPLTDESLKIPYVLITPKYAFEYNRASPALLELSCGGTSSEGVYIKRVYPNSCFDTLKEGDILTRISYNDIYYNNPNAFNVFNKDKSNGTPTFADLDKYGDLTITYNNSISDRKLSIKELFDNIPIGTTITINICRQDSKLCQLNKCGLFSINTTFQYVPSNIRYPIYPRIEPYKYEIIAGMSIGELTINYIAFDDSLEGYAKGYKRYDPVLVVNQIFPNTTASHIRVFKEGSIIKEINGLKVTTISELKTTILNSSDYITFVGKDREKFVIKKSDAIFEDLALLKEFNINNYKYLLTPPSN